MAYSGPEDHPDRGREHIEILKETIDRNRDLDWDNYREQYFFTLIDDGRVRISMIDDKEEAECAVENGVDHIVTVANGNAVNCNCHMAQRYFERKSCRHMRAVDAHPYL